MHITSHRRRSRVARATSAALTAGLALGIAAVVPTAAGAATDEASTPVERSSFVLPVLPDTQFYSRYSASQFVPQYGTNPFEVQTEWIVQHQDELNMPFTVHVGDVVDQEWVAGEWDAADKAMQILTDGGMPYSVVPGNHDVEDMGARSSEGNADNYRARFGAEQLAAQGGDQLVGTYQDGLSSAYLFEAEGRTWMSLALAWNASDDTFAWAQQVLDAHPGVPVILSSHAIVNIAEDQVSPASWWWGEHLFEELIAHNDQIILTVNGHFHGSTMQTRTNDFGNPVYQVLTDYQMAADGGNGIMTLFEFDLTNDRIDVETVSPWVTVKDPTSRASSDAPVLDGTWQSFTLDMDFGERFGWEADAAQEDGGDLSERAKEIVSEGWDGGSGSGALAAAGSADDYIAVDGTIAHWRFGDVAEGVFDESGEIPDIAGESPMYRSAPEHTDAPDEPEDVTVTHSAVPFYAADQGALCFANAARSDSGAERLAYVSTEYGAPATFADLTSETGYTIETFLQLDESWTEGANRWGAALTRGGARSWIGINDSADPGAGASWLGISSLREYQFSAADDATSNSYTLWSGEIMPDSWHHVAIVNDPDARTVIMYVDGVPVLRNASNVGGMVAADYMPWIIGASTWNTEPDHGWNGCVGETRIVDHALDADEFLTARVDIDGDGANFALGTNLTDMRAANARVETLSGAGYPGADVRVEEGEAVLGTAVVGADGSWDIALDEPLAGAGTTRDLTFVQSIGTRDGEPFAATLAFDAAAGETPGPVDPDAGTDAGSDDAGANGAGSAGSDGAASDGPAAATDGAATDGQDGSAVNATADEADSAGEGGLLATGGAAAGIAAMTIIALGAIAAGILAMRRRRAS
ncbi:LamG-like jellyroll fold domain-containing protein [Microbacterium excoecariae]|uniref:LamG-like jellyroll fold domain-containing protein n=1 Tax=Microbacterium excoecariae TaxID=2715210 RepID=UPI00140E419E|nr:LamG-like jellyroll fold domain-containing protein [Microbacterium excoecariae]NHI16571.1 cell wall anchor protein [Microbacterium excoecariae]